LSRGLLSRGLLSRGLLSRGLLSRGLLSRGFRSRGFLGTRFRPEFPPQWVNARALGHISAYERRAADALRFRGQQRLCLRFRVL
jgi:hypothetical protein